MKSDQQRRDIKRRIKGSFLIFLFCFSLISFIPLQAKAQATISWDMNAQFQRMTYRAWDKAEGKIKEAKTKIEEALKRALVTGTVTTIINLMTYMANRFAYDAAVWVASGGDAENPLFDPTPPEDYIKYIAANYAAEFVNNLDAEWFAKCNLCAPFDPYFYLNLRVGFRGAFERPSLEMPEVGGICAVNNLIANWDGYISTLQSTIDDPTIITRRALDTVSASFEPSVSETGVALETSNRFVSEMLSTANAKFNEFIKDSGFQPVVDVITGNVETPASMVAFEFEDSRGQVKEGAYNIGSALMANTDALLQVGTMAASVFTNTLLSEVINNIYEGAFADLNYDLTNPFADIAISLPSRERVVERLKSLRSFTPLQVTEFNLLDEYTACPDVVRGSARMLYNCVIDTSFASAVARAQAGDPLTVQEAISEGYVHGDWALIPPEDKARNQNTNCYQSAYCYSNIVKLRKARIISIGWEMAASSTANPSGSPVTLQEVIDGFYDCNDQNALDSNHPWCHLIDPNWILKFPQSQCRTLAYGQQLEAPGSDSRAEECVDVESCVTEGPDGTCAGGFGYCVREQNVWQFRGDSCPSQYASCLSYKSRLGDLVDYNQNTIDYGGCNEGNQGCLWYATTKTDVGDGYAWPEITNIEIADNQPDAYKNRQYFNANIEECDSSEAGCVELIVREENLSLNLINNSSFDRDEDENDWPDAWISANAAGVTYDTSETQGRSGATAIQPTSATVSQYGLELTQSNFYTLSFYAKQLVQGGANPVSLEIEMIGEDGTIPSLTGTTVRGDCNVKPGQTNKLSVSGTPASNDFERFECTFTSAAFVDKSLAVMTTIKLLPSSVWIDDLQLEQSTDADIWHIGYSESAEQLTTKYAKLPPKYLGCNGADNEPTECAGFAQMCAANDAGCSLYTPVNGDPAVSAVVNELDRCPAICVGYDTYKQEPTRYDVTGEFPLYFIPDSAQQCEAIDVGCDEFTNLDTEEREYFTYLRACVTKDQAADNTNSDNEATYYTWEGSDRSGFQLREWHLLESNLGADLADAPCTHWMTNDGGIFCQDEPNPITDTCQSHEDIFDNPDCREFYDVAGAIHYREWSRTVTVNDECTTYRKTDLAGINAADRTTNCQASGGYFVPETSNCLYYGYNLESSSCDADASGCRQYTGGRSRNSRVVLTDNFEGDLSAWDTYNATDVTLSNESIAVDGHSIFIDNSGITSYIFYQGTECTNPAGCPSTVGNLGGECTIAEGQKSCGTLVGDIFPNKLYSLSFWAKGNNAIIDVYMGSPTAPYTVAGRFAIELDLTSEWQQYSFGPIKLNDFTGDQVLNFNPVGGEYYLDNIVLREGEQDINLIKDTWVTPATCDRTADGIPAPQYHLGCQEYTDQNADLHYLKSFSRLCSPDAVGCTGYYQTNQTESTFAQIFNATCNNLDINVDGQPDKTTGLTACRLLQNAAGTDYDANSQKLCDITPGQSSCRFNLDFALSEIDLTQASLDHLVFAPDTALARADSEIYAILSDQDSCTAAGAGCTEMALPKLSPDRSLVSEWETKYLLDTPENYDELLCNADKLYCESFNAGGRGDYYFKNPQDHVCEYKTDIIISGTKYDGWFRKGTNNFCYGAGNCSGDNAVNCQRNSDCSVLGLGTCRKLAGFCDGDPAITCNLDSDCAEIGVGSCVITTSSYVIGGKLSAIWKNGDLNYTGWVGQCTAEYSGCSEFRDPLDVDDNEVYGLVDGTSYHYIDNENLDENVLRSESRCNGKVSVRQGCSLFNDTSSTETKYNASATYVASVHADTLFGDQPYSLVAPINCDGRANSRMTTIGGEVVDLCKSRCRYVRENIYDISEDPATYNTVSEQYIIGGSCYTVSDCPSMTSESGETFSGTCATGLAGRGDLDGQDVTMPRLVNDTNRILKVQRDRQCSEWLTCASSIRVWDEATASYRTICDGINLCTEYSTGEGDASFCSEWDPNDPAVILDMDRYTSRDISWFGEEYSGYAVPNLYPIQHLSQVNMSPPVGLCNTPGNPEHGQPCTVEGDCGGGAATSLCVRSDTKEYRLGFVAGACDGAHATDCTVGYCSKSGNPCSDAEGCENYEGSCIAGTCYDLTADNCLADTDCSGDEICRSGVCALQTGTCGLNLACAAGSTCFPSVSTKEGSCYRNRCILAVDGSRFVQARTEASSCRAYPEQTSPFPTDIVDMWVKPELDTDNQVSGYDYLEKVSDIIGTVTNADDFYYSPYKKHINFENVNVCEPGEPCECSYKKVTAGTSKYISIDTDTNFIADWVKDEVLSTTGLGICSGGEADGVFCAVEKGGLILGDNAPTDTFCAKAGGICQPISSEDSIIGLPGYCLERDTSININGDPDKQACLTWFPVDQLEGQTDLYAKYKTAGYFEDVYMCTFVEPVVDLLPTKMNARGTGATAVAGDIACVEVEHSCDKGNIPQTLADCADNVVCPAGYFAIVGVCAFRAGNVPDSVFAESCRDPGGGDNDCPYICIPEDSYHTNDANRAKCNKPNPNNNKIEVHTTSDNDGRTDVFAWAATTVGNDHNDAAYKDFDSYISDYSDCVESGHPYNNVESKISFPCSDEFDLRGRIVCEKSTDQGYRELYPQWRVYPACTQVTQVSTENESYAWTQRLWSEGNYQLKDVADNLTYT
ncbi:MAG: hypothetical protein ABH846_00725, partial [Patescibacteria group bacterium]